MKRSSAFRPACGDNLRINLGVVGLLGGRGGRLWRWHFLCLTMYKFSEALSGARNAICPEEVKIIMLSWLTELPHKLISMKLPGEQFNDCV
jgi:hypothetical protein